MRLLQLLQVILVTLLCSQICGCGQNPVTAQREFNFVSKSKEIAMGKEHYRATQQAQGGPYNADPNLVAYVREIGHKLASQSQRPDLPFEFVVVNDSTPNAWTLPGGKIAVNRGLLTELNNEAELAAVLSHEIVHAAARHGAQSMQRGIFMMGALTALNVALKNTEHSDAYMAGGMVASQLTLMKYSRNAEFEADHYGMHIMSKSGYDPNAAVSLQEMFLKLAENKKSNWLKGLFASHPPSKARVVANQQTANTLPSGSTFSERYQANILHLKKTAPAYKAYEEGQKALAKRQVDAALAASETALKLDPKEGLFYALRGDAYMLAKETDKALAEYTKAIQQNPEYYYFYERRGKAYQVLGDKASAKEDLAQSRKLAT